MECFKSKGILAVKESQRENILGCPNLEPWKKKHLNSYVEQDTGGRKESVIHTCLAEGLLCVPYLTALDTNTDGF
jgi:hypothetical protein